MGSALYVHVPFCRHKCIYCDFYSIITTDNISPYLTALKKEIKNYAEAYSGNNQFKSIFFGGGTPSLLPPAEIANIIDALRKNYNVCADAEVTLEANPGTIDKDKLEQFRTAGINRLSVGIQSFDENDLKFLTRIHSNQQADAAIKDAREAGFENINLDLIFNLPKQTKEKWLVNLRHAADLPVTHISAYSLILERGTILNKLVLDGKVKIADEDYDAMLYEETINYLNSKGFVQYEVSNFAKPGYECRHNLAYWEYDNYLGFGPSAHSFANGKRWWNYSSLKKYIAEIERNGSACSGSEVLTDEQKLEEYVMLALRSRGLKKNEFSKLFNNNWLLKNESRFNEYIKNNLLYLNGDMLCLTAKGYAVCDEILAEILG